MYITEDHEALIAIVERKAYARIAENNDAVNIADAKEQGEYNLGFADGVADLCEELKACIREVVEAKERKAAEAVKVAPEKNEEKAAAEQETQAKASKYDN